MTIVTQALVVTVLIASLLGAGATHAGSQAGGEIQFEPTKIAALSKKVEREIAKRGALVAIVSRTGRPPQKLPEGIEFTHVSFAVYSQITTADGQTIPGYAMHNLYQSSESRTRASSSRTTRSTITRRCTRSRRA